MIKPFVKASAGYLPRRIPVGFFPVNQATMNASLNA